MSDKDEKKDKKTLLESFQFELDPEQMENSLSNLREKVRQLAVDSRHTKVRIKFKGKAIAPDIPLGFFVAAEAATFWYGGLIRALVVNLGVRTLIEIEFIHTGDEKVAEGRELYADGEVQEAEKCYREALRLRPKDPEAHYHLGVLLRVIGRRDEAITHLEIAAATEDFPLAEKAQEALDRMKSGKRTL